MEWPDLLSGVGGCKEPLAFIFFAEVGASVQRSAYSLNPDLPFDLLKSVVSPKPMWLVFRTLLKEEWPDSEPTSDDDLIDRALLSCKAMLALGGQIPDGSFDEMQLSFDELFPSAALARSRDKPEDLQTYRVHIGINAKGAHETWFQISPGRNGVAVTILEPNATFTGRQDTFTREEVMFKNLLRLGIQKAIEERKLT
jgi:hypothetical protein